MQRALFGLSAALITGLSIQPSFLFTCLMEMLHIWKDNQTCSPFLVIETSNSLSVEHEFWKMLSCLLMESLLGEMRSISYSLAHRLSSVYRILYSVHPSKMMNTMGLLRKLPFLRTGSSGVTGKGDVHNKQWGDSQKCCQ